MSQELLEQIVAKDAALQTARQQIAGAMQDVQTMSGDIAVLRAHLAGREAVIAELKKQLDALLNRPRPEDIELAA